LSFPFELSLLAATKPEVLRTLARIHAEELARHDKGAAKKSGETGHASRRRRHVRPEVRLVPQPPRSSAHVRLDGVYVEEEDGPRFVGAAPPSRVELYVLTDRVALG
jgi:hypothetical protein